MRLFPLITAILVIAVLYVLVFERDRAFELAGRANTPEASAVVASDEMSDAVEEGSSGSVAVVAMRSQAQEISSFVVVRGRTEAARQVDVRAETTGKVISEPLRKGSLVEAGQMMCRLDPGTSEVSLAEAQARLPEAEARISEARARLPEAQARLAEAEARVTEAEINLTAARKLFEDGYASETRVAAAEAGHEAAMAAIQSAMAGVAGANSGIEAAQAGIQSAQAGIAAAEHEIEQLTITAPFAGFLESDSAETGTLLQPGALCATIIQLDPVKLVGFVPETDVGRVSMGAMAGARLATGQEVFGQVSFLSRSADPTTRTFRVEVTVPNPDGAIRDGQTVEIGIDAEGQPAHLLPMSALTLNDNGDAGVRTVINGNLVRFIPVVILRDDPAGIWLAGLPETAEVIVVGQEYVIDGVTVDVAYREVDQ